MQASGSDWKAEVLDDFAAWLRDLPSEGAGAVPEPPAKRALADLYAEFAALRREVALQGRSQKKALAAFESARDDLSALGDEFKARSAIIAGTIEGMDSGREVREVIVSFLDVRDSLVRTRSLADRLLADDESTPGDWSGLVETFDLIVRKFDRIMEGYGISQIETIGCQFDAATMNAAGSSALPGVPHVAVVEEVRGGFLHDGRILRTAEVFVNMHRQLGAAHDE